MAASTHSGADPFGEYLESARNEYEHAQRQVDEIDLLIRQTSAEVDRLVQRNMRITSRIRQVESTIDSVPREDIREVYSTGLDTQQRLFTMRGQLEKLQSDQHNVSRYSTMIRGMLEIVGAADYEPEVSDRDDDSAQLLAIRIIEAQERERQILSRQMHDGPAQALTNLVLQAEICERLFDVDAERARAELVALKDAVAGTFQKVKGLILNLRPMMLDDLGLVPTLRRYVDSYCDNTGVLASLTLTGKERRLEPHKEVIVFRAVQELLNNAHEHNHATSVQITLDVSEDVVCVTVEDNGIDSDSSEFSVVSDVDRLGLSMMRERLDMLGGTIHTESGVGRGTRVGFEVPVS